MCIWKMNNDIIIGDHDPSSGIFGKYLQALNICINILKYILDEKKVKMFNMFKFFFTYKRILQSTIYRPKNDK